MTFDTACKKMYDYCISHGNPGIAGIGNTRDFWVFVPASDIDNVVDYSAVPIFINKVSGVARRIDYCNVKDMDMFYSADNIIVPEKYKPVYG